MKNWAVVLSCEHAVNLIPAAYAGYFAEHQALLHSHQGSDFNALNIAKRLSESLGHELVTAKASRLLIDCNRSLHHADCFSVITRNLPVPDKLAIIEEYYLPYRHQVNALIQAHCQNNQPVLHLSIHSFTPVLNGHTRTADLGLLYDPKRQSEKQFARQWKKRLREGSNTLSIRCNYPYRGTSDGLTTALRRLYSDEQYCGIEVECNQQIIESVPLQEKMAALLLKTLRL